MSGEASGAPGGCGPGLGVVRTARSLGGRKGQPARRLCAAGSPASAGSLKRAPPVEKGSWCMWKGKSR